MRLQQIRDWWIWAYYFNPATYTIYGCVVTQLGDVTDEYIQVGESPRSINLLKSSDHALTAPHSPCRPRNTHTARPFPAPIPPAPSHHPPPRPSTRPTPPRSHRGVAPPLPAPQA